MDINVKECSYTAQYPVQGLLKAIYTSPPTDLFIQVPNSISLGSIQPSYNYSTKTICSHIHLSVARYSFVELSELWQHGMNEIAKALKWQQEDSNPGSLD